MNPLGHAVRLPHAASARVLACGAHLKNRACLVEGDRVVWSEAHGDLDGASARAALLASVDDLLARTSGPVHAIACDLHPDFFSTRLAHDQGRRLGVPVMGVQHHLAHVGVVLAEHGVADAALGVVLDGMGLGLDGSAWGGELLWVPRADAAQDWQRPGHLAPLRLPGGEVAAREPWRLAAAVLFGLGRGDEIMPVFGPVVGESAARLLHGMLQRQLNCPSSSSAGRWFDAAAGALGICVRQSAEAEAAQALEELAARWLATHANFQVDWRSLDLAPVVGDLFALRATGDDRRGAGAARFHLALASGLAHAVAGQAVARHGPRVVLAGGCFANRVLAHALRTALVGRGLTVLEPLESGGGDAGLALGQAWMAARQLAGQAVGATVAPVALEH